MLAVLKPVKFHLYPESPTAMGEHFLTVVWPGPMGIEKVNETYVVTGVRPRGPAASKQFHRVLEVLRGKRIRLHLGNQAAQPLIDPETIRVWTLHVRESTDDPAGD